MSLPDLLAGEALEQLGGGRDGRSHGLIVGHLVAELLQADPRRTPDYIEALLDHGISLERLINGYVPAAADLLGEAWCDDRLTFSDVTHASGMLMQIVRDYAPQPPAVIMARGGPPPRVLLVRPRGEEHVLGMTLVARAMRAAGWLVRVELTQDPAALSAALAGQHYDLIGLTASGPACEAAVAEVIGLGRRTQAAARIVVGGHWIVEEPDAAARLGADAAIGRGVDPVNASAEILGLEVSAVSEEMRPFEADRPAAVRNTGEQVRFLQS